MNFQLSSGGTPQGQQLWLIKNNDVFAIRMFEPSKTPFGNNTSILIIYDMMNGPKLINVSFEVSHFRNSDWKSLQHL